jgi:hypothetical protein
MPFSSSTGVIGSQVLLIPVSHSTKSLKSSVMLITHSYVHEKCFAIQTAAKGKDIDQDQKLLNIPFK